MNMTFEEWQAFFGCKDSVELSINLDSALEIIKSDREFMIWASALLATNMVDIIKLGADSNA